ncbi:MAG: hydroxyacylglutathione hydrolase [Paracoccaceae bacterium]
MPLEIVTIPCLQDNYAYLVRSPDGTCLIDAPDAAPIAAELTARGWGLDVIMITHHHWDHVQGVADLRAAYGCKVLGPKAEEDKLPPLDWAMAEGMNGGNGDGYTEPLSVPGHTLGHMAFHFSKAGVVFTADSLMGLGCGRLFEGTPEMMYHSLAKLAALPPETLVYSGHEYSASNARFALSVDPDNAALQARAAAITDARAKGHPTVPVTLGEERATNPFLRTDDPAIQAAVGLPGGDPVAVFAALRAAKDTF